MDQIKVGNYIAQKRKELGLTQKALAEKIEVTDKLISKWERGNGLPDVTRLKPLCEALKVSMNELAAVILTPLYGTFVYMVATIVNSHQE